MRIRINGRADLAEATPDTPLGEVLDGIRRFAADEGLEVGELRLDGEALTAGLEADRREVPTGRFALLEVRLVVPPPLEGVEERVAGIRAARERVETAASLLSRGRRREALQELAALVDGLGRSLRASGADPNALQALKGILERLNRAIGSGDDVEAADLLAYELGPMLRSLEAKCSP